MIKSTFDLENELISEGYEIVIGIDEVGRGPLAGPVVACATTARNFQFLISNFAYRQTGFQSNPNEQISKFKKQLDMVRDSKTLSAKQREDLFDFIHEHFFVGVGICDHKTIDRINILEASFLAMKQALMSLKSKIKNQNAKFSHSLTSSPGKRGWPEVSGEGKTKFIILLDGNKLIPNFSHEQKAIVNGDKLVKSISSASIIAKVTRDRIMMEMHEKYPEYDFAKHKGYGTRAHMNALVRCGPCPIHRQSFHPISKLAKMKK